MIKALQKDQVLLDDIVAANNDQTGFHLWWLGQSGYLIQWQGKHLLIDPYLSDSLTKKYAATDKPHIRMTERVIAPERLEFIDIVSSSHNHTDHLDGDTLIPLMAANPELTFIIPRANRAFVANRIQSDINFPIGLNEGESITLANGFTIHGIPAAHNELEKDEAGNCKFMGYVFQFGAYSVYHSGDTLWREEIITALKPFDIDVAILPINGNKPERRVAGNLDAKEAVTLGKEIKAGCVIPCHYDMFTFNTVAPDEFVTIAQQEQQAHQVLQCGERLTVRENNDL